MVREVPYVGTIGNAAKLDVGTGAETVAAGDDPRLVAVGAVISKMTTPMITGHRCGGSASGTILYGPAPENSLEGARLLVEAATAQNLQNFVLNVQCRQLADGSVAAVHDATVDRTTTASGNVADYTAGGWLGLSMDAATYTGAPAWGDNLRMPLLDDFLREFGGKVALNIAAYTPGGGNIGQVITRKVVARGLQASVMIGSFTPAQLTAPRDAGIATIYYPPDEGQTGSTAAEILATGLWAPGMPKYIGVSSSSTDGYIQGLIAAEFHVGAYFTARRYDWTRLLALGVHHIISDDVIYQATGATRLYPSTTGDPYTFGAWPHGALPGDNRNRGSLSSNGQKLDDTANLQFSVQGGRCPYPNPTACTFTGSITFDTVGSDATRSAQLIFGCPDDMATSGLANSGAGLPDGYTLVVRANGNVELYRDTRVGQGNTKVGSTLSTTAITQGTTITFTLQITPTTIVFTRTDGTPASVTWTDSTYRGSYYHVGKSGAGGALLGVSWKITSIA